MCGTTISTDTICTSIANVVLTGYVHWVHTQAHLLAVCAFQCEKYTHLIIGCRFQTASKCFCYFGRFLYGAARRTAQCRHCCCYSKTMYI